MYFMLVVKAAISLLPVLLFLSTLVILDSYKLVRLRSIVFSILVGSLTALAASVVADLLVSPLRLEHVAYRRYGAPLLEEFLKAGYIVFLLRSHRAGFMVDAAIYGFAVGAGFALVENTFYLYSLPEDNVLIWLVRGLGTAVMHGGTTAVLGITAKTMADRTSSLGLRVFLPGYALASLIHSIYNHFFFSPVLSTLLILIILPIVMILVFQQSEHALRRWLRVGFDTDQELLQTITSGQLSESPVGQYLRSLQTTFQPEVVVDMLCYIRLHVELSIQAKGILLMRQAGFEVPQDPAVKEKFDELQVLGKNIGQTGKLAVLPFLHTSGRELWQMHMLGAGQGA